MRSKRHSSRSSDDRLFSGTEERPAGTEPAGRFHCLRTGDQPTSAMSAVSISSRVRAGSVASEKSSAPVRTDGQAAWRPSTGARPRAIALHRCRHWLVIRTSERVQSSYVNGQRYQRSCFRQQGSKFVQSAHIRPGNYGRFVQVAQSDGQHSLYSLSDRSDQRTTAERPYHHG